MARIAKPRLQKTLVGNGSLRKLHWSPQHSCLLGAALAGWLDRAYLTDDHGFGTSLHAVHLTGGCYLPPRRPPKTFFFGSPIACPHFHHPPPFSAVAPTYSFPPSCNTPPPF